MVQIRLAPGADNILNLAEVQLFHQSSVFVPIHRSNLTATLSTTANAVNMWKATNAIDSNTSSTVLTDIGDPDPWLRITYPCSTGSTMLSKVVVTNRQDAAHDRINSFQLHFLNAKGDMDRPSFRFAGSHATYVIDVPPGR